MKKRELNIIEKKENQMIIIIIAFVDCSEGKAVAGSVGCMIHTRRL